MADIRIVWDQATGTGDWSFTPPKPSHINDQVADLVVDEIGRTITDGLFLSQTDLASGGDLVNAVFISLFTDASAGPDDVILDRTDDGRGWWGDLGRDVPIGSKIWLRQRSRQDALTLALVKADVEECLRWLVDDGVAASIDVKTEWARPSLLGCTIVITEPAGNLSTFAFGWAWKDFA